VINYHKVNLQFFGGKVGFTAGNEPVKDSLSDDPTMKEILEASSAIALLTIIKRLANQPLTEMDRQIYYEAIDAKAKADFNAWCVERAAEKEEEQAKKPVGFTMENATVTIATDSITPKFAVIRDSQDENQDICMANAVPIVDSSGQPSGWYKQPVSRVDTINGNNRIYPRSVYQPTLDSIKQSGFPYAGEHPHPRSLKGLDGRVLFDSKVPNQAVRFRNAEIDSNGVVWAEYRPLETEMGKQVQAMLDAGLPIGFSNRMTGDIVPTIVEGKNVGVARKLNLYTWDVVLNPAEPDAFSTPIQLTDSAMAVILDSLKEGEQMNFLTMSLNELKSWKSANAGHKDMALCDQAITLKEAVEKNNVITDELEKLRKEKADREAKEATENKKKQAQQALNDAVNALSYEQHVKDGLLQKGAVITDASEVASFIETEKAFVDSISINSKLNALGFTPGRAQTLDPSVRVTNEAQPWKPIVDNLQAALDDQIRSMDRNFRPDQALRDANIGILDRVMAKLDRENSEEYRQFMKSLTDSAQSIENGVITDSALSTTGDFAQVATISMAFMRQVWQDLKFAQLVMAEAFAGTTYKIPVEFQSHDLYTQDDFVTGEYDGISTEGVSTFLLEFGGEWLKRGTVISKESLIELQKGPFNYDVVARNLANLALRYQRIIDNKMSLEMLHTSDEYQAKVVNNEAVAAAEMSNTGLPVGSNATWSVKLLCGNTSGNLPATIPPIVRPRQKVWLDQTGRKQTSMVNDIDAKKGATDFIRGSWDPIKGMINPLPGKASADYAVDFENAVVYFAASSGVDNNTNLPTISYSYATNVSFFNLKVPTSLADNPARYYNQLLERFDYERAYMGSTPRYVAPDFAIGSLNAMVNLKIAELFYKWASPDGTTFLKGDMWIASRNGLQIGEMNAPWAAGDQRILLGKTNATRFGVGSPLQMEGPEPYFDPTTMKITSAKQYYATQQIALATPLVIDENGVSYNPPYRTIKFYNA
jgi:hypothetical protein